MYVLHTNDSILAGPNKAEVDKVIKQIKKAKLDITKEGDIKDFLGVNNKMKKDGTIRFTQPHLIKSYAKQRRWTTTNWNPRIRQQHHQVFFTAILIHNPSQNHSITDQLLEC